MAIVSTEQVGVVQRLLQSIKSMGIGLIILLLAFPLLFWNEGRAVRTAKSLSEGAASVVAVDATRIDPANEGALVHFTGAALTPNSLSDPNFGVTVDAIRLRRTVEMYQYKEQESTQKRDKIGGGQERVTTYTYDTVWHDSLIDSRRFHDSAAHVNPTSMRYQGQDWQASPVTVGAFTLSPTLVSSMNSWEDLTVNTTTDLPPALSGVATAHDGRYYFAVDPLQPVVGDLRVAFDVVWPADVSVIAEQAGTGTRAYQTQAGDSLSMLQMGLRGSDEMFAQAQSANTTLTWMLRLLGLFMMFSGLTALFRPLAVIAGVVPFFGRAVSLFASVVAGVIALMFWCVTIAIAWLFVRPLLAIALFIGAAVMLVIAIGLGVVLIRSIRSSRAAA